MSTIDPGIEETINEKADPSMDDKDGAKDDAAIDEAPTNEEAANEAQRTMEQDEREDFEFKNRWWFASVAAPLLAGTFGPMATAFNILALAYYWRESIPTGVPPGQGEKLGHTIKDPPWNTALNALSLVCALVGNGSLLLNMARRVRFEIAQPLTIAGYMLAGLLLIADVSAMSSGPHYWITQPALIPNSRHALTSAFYYACYAAGIYTCLAFLMCFTVYGAVAGKYTKQFQLTLSQRSLMLQTMSLVTYLLLGALVYSHIEAWDFLTAVYWADVTILTIGFGDISPKTSLGRGLLFPFAMGGVLTLGLVIGSIRSLVLERGSEKMSARMLEKRRAKAVTNVDSKREVVKISMFARAHYRIDPDMSLAQKREQEFDVMRKVQKAADSERRYFALFNSALFAVLLWLVGAVIFQQTEYLQDWTYLEAVYMAYVALLTIGYGDFAPKSNSGRAFFVFWSLLAIPSLTILISNMGDTVVKWVSDMTEWVSRFTVLPGEEGFRASLRAGGVDIVQRFSDMVHSFTGPGVFGISPRGPESSVSSSEYENKMLDRLAERLDHHVDDDEREQWKQLKEAKEEAQEAKEEQDKAKTAEEAREKDIMFYHYVLSRECRNLQKIVNNEPSKQFSWADWEYYLKLVGDQDDPEDYPGQKHPDLLVPEPLRAPDGLRSTDPVEQSRSKSGSDTDASLEKESTGRNDNDATNPHSTDGNIDRATSVREKLEAKRKSFGRKNQRPTNPDDMPYFLRDWSWLSNESPLLSNRSEAAWILERMSAALERELNRHRKGYRATPPIGLKDARRRALAKEEQKADGGAEEREKRTEQRHLAKAEKEEVEG